MNCLDCLVLNCPALNCPVLQDRGVGKNKVQYFLIFAAWIIYY
jgi:hypothetical protein